MSNPRNTVVLTGRLARDPYISKSSVLMTLMVKQNYVNKAGERGADAIDLVAFLCDGTQGAGPYAHLAKGSLITVAAHLRSSTYEKDGQTQYSQDVVIDSVEFLEPKSATEARKGQGQGAQQDAAAQAAGPDFASGPFQQA